MPPILVRESGKGRRPLPPHLPIRPPTGSLLRRCVPAVASKRDMAAEGLWAIAAEARNGRFPDESRWELLLRYARHVAVSGR